MRDDTSTRRRQRCRATLPSHRRSSPYESGTKAVTVHNQRHPGPLIRNDAPTEASTVQDRRIRPRLSHINRRIAVAHHPAQHTSGRPSTAESGSIRSGPAHAHGRAARVLAALRAAPPTRHPRDPITVRVWVVSLSWSPVPPFSGGTAVVLTARSSSALLTGQYLGVPPDPRPAGSHSRWHRRCRVTLP